VKTSHVSKALTADTFRLPHTDKLSLGYGAARQSFELMVPGLVLVGMGAGFMNGEIARVGMTVSPPELAGMADGCAISAESRNDRYPPEANLASSGPLRAIVLSQWRARVRGLPAICAPDH
jgi:hypothetical protein